MPTQPVGRGHEAVRPARLARRVVRVIIRFTVCKIRMNDALRERHNAPFDDEEGIRRDLFVPCEAHIKQSANGAARSIVDFGQE